MIWVFRCFIHKAKYNLYYCILAVIRWLSKKSSLKPDVIFYLKFKKKVVMKP